MDVFKGRIGFRVDSGYKVKFWKDWLCGDTSLKELFPKIFLIASSMHKLLRCGRWIVGTLGF